MPFTDPNSLHVAVVGLGYIGLPTAAILATRGVSVTGVDVSTETVEAVNRGEVPFVEPDLETAVAGVVRQERLRAQSSVPTADVYIVAVPTPFLEDHAADLSYIDSATDALAPVLESGALVILESTSPPGTTEHMAQRILAARPDLSLDGSDGRGTLHVAHCPERVLPGQVMVELVTNDRVVGGMTSRAAEYARDVYRLFCRGDVVMTDTRTAELTKLVENSFRDVNIAFANELSLVSDRLGVDVWELIRLANLHPRVNILQPGPGVGGHCIAVDPWFIVSSAPEEARLIRTAREVNDAKPGQVVERVIARAERFRHPRIATLGLAFKRDIDDLRESPAMRTVATLAERLPDSTILAVEPHIGALPEVLAEHRNIELVTLDRVAPEADIVVVLVDHTVFRQVDPRALHLEEKVLIDTRGMWH